MPRMKIRRYKGKMDCPVCEQRITGELVKIGKEVIARKYECPNPICGYAYYSEQAQSAEYFGTVYLGTDFEYPSFKPDLGEIRTALNQHRKKRKALLLETRTILNDPDCKMIFDCLDRPGCDEVGLSRAFYTWLKRRRKQFPFHLKVIKERIQRNESNEKGRKANEEDHNGNGGFQPGTGPNRGPMG